MRKKEPTAQIAHLVFADTQANAEKPKELFFANVPEYFDLNNPNTIKTNERKKAI